MKKLTVICTTAILCLAISCKKSDPPAKETLTINKTSISFYGHPYVVDSITIQYSGNWTIAKTPNVSWLTLSATGGSGNTTVYVTTAEKNETGAARSASITVTPVGDASHVATVSVSQGVFGPIGWNRLIGGNIHDQFYAVCRNAAGAFVGAGTTTSNNGDISGNHGSFDVWVAKFDVNGVLAWNKVFGGAGEEMASAIIQAPGGGYIVAGYTRSNDGDVTQQKGNGDVWVIKLDENGTKVWQKTYGGTGYDYASAVVATSDNGFLISGATESRDGDVTGQHSLPATTTPDVWLIKIDGSGNIQWQKAYGGTGKDESTMLLQTADGGFLSVGSSDATTTNGDVTPVHGANGFADFWVFKTDATGNLVWQKSYGGTSAEAARTALALTDGYLIGGYAMSNDGQVTNFKGTMDTWVIKIDLTGNLVWQKTFGGSGWDYLNYLAPDGDGFIFGASTTSNDGDVTGNHGTYDAWVLKMDASGNKQWQKAFGGTGDDDPARYIYSLPNGSYLVSSSTQSNGTGDVPSGNHGNFDVWIFNFRN